MTEDEFNQLSDGSWKYEIERLTAELAEAKRVTDRCFRGNQMDMGQIMTNEEILLLAKQCGFDTRDGFDGPLITFAQAIAQSTLKKCAEACDDVANRAEPDDFAIDAATDCAEAIRSMTNE